MMLPLLQFPNIGAIRTADDAECALHEARGARKHVVGGRGGDDHQVDVGRAEAGSLERRPGGTGTEDGTALLGRSDVALTDAGAGDDPVVGRLDASRSELGGERRVVHEAFRQGAAGADDAGVDARGSRHWG